MDNTVGFTAPFLLHNQFLEVILDRSRPQQLRQSHSKKEARIQEDSWDWGLNAISVPPVPLLPVIIHISVLGIMAAAISDSDLGYCQRIGCL
jgi:hypothetical protein